jgi:4-diphosphocytidyl-2-C-methyl-D-erythritol kinase
MATIHKLAAPAKVNLALHVVGQRADGYHLIETIALFPRVGDTITIAAAARDSFDIDGPFAGDLGDGGANLVETARDWLRERYGAKACGPVAIRLEKTIPVASGLGGGSSDAAATLRGLSRHWRIGDEAWRAAVVELGADLPMCLECRPLIARGIGEKLTMLEGLPDFAILLVNPGVPVSTPDVFRALGKRDNPPLAPIPELLRGGGFSAFCGWLSSSRNDLQEPAIGLQPAIAEALGLIEVHGAALTRMSGSGASCFGLFGEEGAARDAAARIREIHPAWYVTAAMCSHSGADAHEAA